MASSVQRKKGAEALRNETLHRASAKRRARRERLEILAELRKVGDSLSKLEASTNLLLRDEELRERLLSDEAAAVYYRAFNGFSPKVSQEQVGA